MKTSLAAATTVFSLISLAATQAVGRDITRNTTTFVPKPGYTGSDAFVIEATARDKRSAGTPVLPTTTMSGSTTASRNDPLAH